MGGGFTNKDGLLGGGGGGRGGGSNGAGTDARDVDGVQGAPETDQVRERLIDGTEREAGARSPDCCRETR